MGYFVFVLLYAGNTVKSCVSLWIFAIMKEKKGEKDSVSINVTARGAE